MGQVRQTIGTVLILAALGGCTRVQTAEVQVPPRGELLNIRHIIAANPQKKACVGYDAATNSCASVISYTRSTATG